MRPRALNFLESERTTLEMRVRASINSRDRKNSDLAIFETSPRISELPNRNRSTLIFFNELRVRTPVFYVYR